MKKSTRDFSKSALKILEIVRTSWITYAVLLLLIAFLLSSHYLNNTTTEMQHDLFSHVEYSQKIATTHHLPGPYDGWSTYQPPLFYLFTQAFHPLQNNVTTFIQSVRSVSLYLFGGIFYLCLIGIAAGLKLPKSLSLLGATYLATLPSMVILFTSYNNDTLATALIAIIALSSLKFYQSKSKKTSYLWALLLVISSIMALYTKYTALFALFALGCFVLIGWAFKKFEIKRALTLMGIYLGAFLCLIPWLIFHNHSITGKYFPNNVESPYTMAFASLDLQEGRTSFLLTPPAVTNGEWTTPFVYDHNQGDLYWTKRTIVSSAFATTLFDEWDLVTLHNKAADIFFPISTWGWLAVWSQVAALAFLITFWKSPLGKAALGLMLLIFGTHLIHVGLIQPFMNAANFRYYAWISIPLLVALVTSISQAKKSSTRSALIGVIILGLGCLIHVGLVLSLF